MSRTQAEYYAYTPRTQFNSKKYETLKSEIDDISPSLMIMSKKTL
jgi:hypothetical protein